jgi:asparagine synthase (glutamine-hydrolysing)
MCGINGIFAYHYAANPIDREELVRTRDHMAARGPDGSGVWFSDDARAGFGHRRLSIVDLSDNGSQPMISSDGRFVVTFNGEIYNHRQLRRALEEKGYVFRSRCDTEVLLHLFAEKGEAMVHDLRGMFAFAIWDARHRSVFLARDPYGIKPLYYADDGWTFRFASQVKALLAGGRVSREKEPAGQVGFFLWGSVPEPFTTFQAIRALPAGATLCVDALGIRSIKRYHTIAGAFHGAADVEGTRLCPAGLREEMTSELLDSVRHHTIADVPVGAFLSAGIDSGSLVGLMRDCGQSDIQTITIAFEEFRGGPNDEAPRATEVAKLYGTHHTTRIVTEGEFRADLPAILTAMDQPSIDGFNTWFVAKAAREQGLKVAISGLGGDELFGGYPSFTDIPRWVSWCRLPSAVPFLGLVARRLMGVTALDRALGHPKAAGMLELGGSAAGAYLLRRGLYMPWELGALLDAEIVRLGLKRLDPLGLLNAELQPLPLSSQARVAILESTAYMRNQLLRDTDWASMAHGLEVRTPLVDSVLLQRLAPGIAGTADVMLRKSDLAASPSVPLPATITDRAKTGFETPIASWIQRHERSTVSPGTGRRAGSTIWPRQWACEVAAA